MDPESFLSSQFWLTQISSEAEESLRKLFTFHTILSNAYCSFQSGGEIIVFCSHGALSFTQFKIELFISVDDREQKWPAALYIIFNGKSYIVNHTLMVVHYIDSFYQFFTS